MRTIVHNVIAVLLALSISCEIPDENKQPAPDNSESFTGSGWVQTWGTTVDEGSCDVEFVAFDGDFVYTVGNYHRIVDFDPTDEKHIYGVDDYGVSIYISKFESDGDYIWTRPFQGKLGNAVDGIALNSSDEIFITGSFKENVDFNPGNGVVSRRASNIAGQRYLLKLDSEGNYQWVKTWLGNQSGCLTVGPDNLIYVTGYLTEDVYDKQNEAKRYDMADEVDINSTEIGTAFVLIFNGDGEITNNYNWTIPEDGNININDLTVDQERNLYIAGDFTGAVDLAMKGSDTGFRVASMGESDSFVIKVDPDGSVVWAESWGGALRDGAVSIAINSSGDLFIGGIFDSTVDFDPGDGKFELKSNGAIDCFVTHLTSKGDFNKATSWGGSDFDWLAGLKVDTADNVLTCGIYNSPTDFDPGELQNVREVDGFGNMFLSKFDSDLKFKWVYTPGMARIEALTTDKFNNIYAAGYYLSTVDFDPGEGIAERPVHDYLAETAFLLKLLPNGGWTNDYEPPPSIKPGEEEPSGEAGTGPDEFQNVVTVKSTELETTLPPENIPVSDKTQDDESKTAGWAVTFGEEREDIVEGAGVDSDGNIYVLSGRGGGALTRASNPSLRKFSPDGVLEWTRPNNDTPMSCIFVDDNGDCYIGGARNIRSTPPGNSFYAANITRFTPDGEIDRLHSLGQHGKSSIEAVYVCDSGEIYLSGFFSETEDFDFGEGIYELSPPDDISAFVAMYTHDFEFLWAAAWAGRYMVSGTALELDSNGNVYVSGYMIEDDPARSSPTYTATNFNTVNSFIRKFTWDGNPEWACVFENPSHCYFSSMAVDNSGCLYLCGFYSGLLDADPGPDVLQLTANEQDALIIKMCSNGDFSWAVTFSGEYIQEAIDIAIGPTGRIFITGDFMYEVDFNPGEGEFLMSAPVHDEGPRTMDAFLCALSSEGEFVHAIQLDSPGFLNRGSAIAVDRDGWIVLSGIFTAGENTAPGLDFNPGEDEDFHMSLGFNTNDVFVAKYNSDMTW